MPLTTPKFFLAHWWGCCVRVYGLYWENSAGSEQKSVWLSSLSVEIGNSRCLGREEEQGKCFVHVWKGLGVGEVKVAWRVNSIFFPCVLGSTNYMRFYLKQKYALKKRRIYNCIGS